MNEGFELVSEPCALSLCNLGEATARQCRASCAERM